MKSLFKNLFLLTAFVLTLAIGYYLYSGTGGLTDSSNNGIATDVTVEAQMFLNRLHALEVVKLDSVFLSDYRFTSLEVFTPPVEPEPIGRDNPFELN